MLRKTSNVRYVGEPAPDAAPEVNKRGQAATRDRQESLPLTPAQLDAAREKRQQEAAAYMANPPRIVSGHNLTLEIVGATIEKGEIRAALVARGIVQRPEGAWRAITKTLELRIPAQEINGE